MGNITLRELCDALSISRRTVQRYEEAGLVSATGKNKYGYLLYDERAQKRIGSIRSYQEMGFKLKEIAEIFDAPDKVIVLALKKRVSILVEERSRIERLIVEIQQLICAMPCDE